MKSLRIILVVSLALVAIGAAGCTGGTGLEGSEPSSDTAPSLLAPSTDLGQGGVSTDVDETNNDQDDVTDVPSDGDSGSASTSIKCEFDSKVQAQVGTPYSQTLAASGGSGDFRFEATDLPAGLSLSSSGTFSGTPAKAGEKKASIKVIDIQSDEHQHCTIKFTIRETISVQASQVISRSSKRVVWKLSVNGTGDGSIYRWSFSPSTNLCGSTGIPTSDASCPSPVLSGKSVYIWMKSGVTLIAETAVVATVSSDFANTASLPIVFPSNMPTLIPGLSTITANPDLLDSKPVDKIGIRLVTGWMDKAGTSCTVRIDYSEAADGPWKKLVDVTDDLGQGDYKHFSPTVPEGMTSKHQYFKVTVKNEGCGDSWNLQGVDFDVQYADGSSYDYRNPCIYDWIPVGESLRFGPKDTAVCAITGTATGKDNETNDTVYLLVEKRTTTTPLNAGSKELTDRGGTSIFLNNTELAAVEAADAVKENNFFLHLDVYGYNDREQGKITAYGDYAFDSDPFGDEVKLLKDSGHDGWKVESLEAFIFSPSAITQGGSMRYGFEDGMELILDGDGAGITLQQEYLQLTSTDDVELLIPADDWTSIADQH